MLRTERVYIIAEAGVNHNGSLEIAKQLIDVACEAGADAIKFQTFKAEKLVGQNAPKAEYQTKTTDVFESQFEMIKKLELDETAHRVLIDYCLEKGIQFLSTPFDLESVDLLANSFNLPRLKISSGEITNAPLLLKAARSGKPIILSTGMSTLGDVEQALAVLAFGYTNGSAIPSINAFNQAYCSTEGQRALQENVVLLHCTTEYPTPFEDVNLSVMDTLSAAFGLPVGFSDHTPGIAVPAAAVARGAVVIEKHFTLDKTLPGPDHKASLEPDELYNMIQAIRQVEAAIGNPVKSPAPSELKNLSVARKSLVAARVIQKGEIFTEENLTVKRPGGGISPMLYWEWLGKKAEKNYEPDEKVST
ncbi:N-acetylneuraminate synthase [Effusibacillus dendaii]|uniref:Sialic acid synthase n=1 Tax=Effusibacillus dendaii TaxID=2743772 RepID=A0A7I8DJ65_9BACL|nr:N-acetylneuraminate synthase [Effusibacillus dendaii]BCJ87881.1 sialic acid synthase [Effusibacillus dendaii]